MQQSGGLELQSLQPLWDATVEVKAKQYATAAIDAVSDRNIIIFHVLIKQSHMTYFFAMKLLLVMHS